MDIQLNEDILRQLAPQDFEKLVLALLQELGCRNTRLYAGGIDKGYDIVAEVPVDDPLALSDSYRVAVLCKHYAHSGRSVSLNDMAGTVSFVFQAAEFDRLLLVTSTRLTASALDRIAALNRTDRGTPPIYVWAADEIVRLLFRFPVLVSRFFKPQPVSEGTEPYTPDQRKIDSLFKLVGKAMESGSTSEKGDSLEDFVAELFSSLAGWSCPRRRKRTGSNEIDCVFRNENTTHPLLREMGTTIPAECKCVKAPVSSRDVQVFDAVVKECGAAYGLFITTSRFTGAESERYHLGDAMLVIKAAFKDGRHLICLDGEDLKQLSLGDDLIEVLWTRVEDIRTS